MRLCNVSEPRRHHFVPRNYLKRWVDAGRVQMHRRDGRSFSRRPEKVAYEIGFYDTTDATGARSTEVETYFNDHVESPAWPVFELMDRSGVPPANGTPERIALARFMAFQATRTNEDRQRWDFPNQFLAFADGEPLSEDLVKRFLRQYLGFEPDESEVKGALTFLAVSTRDGPTSQDVAVRVMLDLAARLVPALLAKSWTIEHDRKSRFITSDSPMLAWRSPSPLDEIEGVGLVTADEVRFPLGPDKQLVLTTRPRSASSRVTTERVRACNADLGAACHTFIVGRRPKDLATVELASARPLIRFAYGPYYEHDATGRRIRKGEMMHIRVPIARR
jgi:hypothetical protein